MSDLRKHSDAAWEIASRYSDVLASETRDLAAAIDVQLSSLRDQLKSQQGIMAGWLIEKDEEIERLRDAKTAALRIADERAKEAVELRQQLVKAQVPDGYVLMPKEASRAMTMAGCDSLPSCEYEDAREKVIVALTSAYRKDEK